MEIEDLQRHLYFRMIKAAIDSGEIENPRFRTAGVQKANKDTMIRLDEFTQFLTAKGVID